MAHRLAIRSLWAAALVLAALLAAPSAPAALRCDGQLVAEGDRPYDLLAACGEPDYREDIPGVYLPGIGILVAEELWYYNRGPQQLLQVVHIREGRITTIDTPGYGFDVSIEGQCDPKALRVGMSRFELITRCGEPTYRERRLQVLPGDPRQPYGQLVPIEEWTYDLGPGNLIRILTLTDGTVRSIVTGRPR
jgi:hypothetical protein